MRNAVIGFIGIVILVLCGVTIQTSGNRNVRQNELDSNLSAAIENSMEILTVNPMYAIDKNSQKEFVADFVQNMLLSTTSDAKFHVDVHTVDVRKGVLDVEVKETYSQVVGTGNLSARKTTVLEDYENSNNKYYTVTFIDNSKDSKVMKQVKIHGGDALTGAILPQNINIPKGKKLEGWKMTKPSMGSVIYNQENLNQIRVTQELEFTTSYVAE